MNKLIKSQRNIDRISRLISKKELDCEIGDNSIIIDVYKFSRNREVHVYYSIYNSSSKGYFIVYK